MIGLIVFALIWGVGRWRRAGAAFLCALSGIWWLVLMAAHSPLLGGGTLARVTGGDLRAWGLFGLLAGLAGLYFLALRAVRAKARKPEAPATPPAGSFSETELNRYARHILLREIGGPGQRRLKEAKVLVVGAGGLGSPALLYLASVGVGTIGVIDPDVVDSSNLQRQVIHTDARIGMPKVFSAEAAMKALNPFIQVRPYHRSLDDDIAAELVAEYDIILDGTDNFDTRERVNRVCAHAGKPLIAGALTQWEGQLSVWDPAQDAPCYACVFPNRPAPGMVPTCAEAGVAAPLPGIIGAMMAGEAVKLITGAGEPLRGRLMIHDMLHAETRVIGVKRRADCLVCGSIPSR